MSLSDKIKPIDSDCDEHLLIEDVKEFIKELKRVCKVWSTGNGTKRNILIEVLFRHIDEEAGDKLC